MTNRILSAQFMISRIQQQKLGLKSTKKVSQKLPNDLLYTYEFVEMA